MRELRHRGEVTEAPSDQWVCETCQRQLFPPRSRDLASPKFIAIARSYGFSIADDAKKDYVHRLLELHRYANYYVFDVWEELTGQRATFQLGSRSCMDRFATRLFRDLSRVRRLVAIQMQRDAMKGTGQLAEFQKPPLEHDADFEFIAERLRDEWPEHVPSSR